MEWRRSEDPDMIFVDSQVKPLQWRCPSQSSGVRNKCLQMWSRCHRTVWKPLHLSFFDSFSAWKFRVSYVDVFLSSRYTEQAFRSCASGFGSWGHHLGSRCEESWISKTRFSSCFISRWISPWNVRAVWLRASKSDCWKSQSVSKYGNA